MSQLNPSQGPWLSCGFTILLPPARYMFGICVWLVSFQVGSWLGLASIFSSKRVNKDYIFKTPTHSLLQGLQQDMKDIKHIQALINRLKHENKRCRHRTRVFLLCLVLSFSSSLPLGHHGLFRLISVATPCVVGPSWLCSLSGLSAAQNSSTTQSSSKAQAITYELPFYSS